MKPRIVVTLELSAKRGKRLSFLNLAYAECIKEAGGIPLHFPPLPSRDYIHEAVSTADGLVLTGGADIHPSYYGEEISAPVFLSPDQRTEFDLELFREGLQAGKAILAICHGMQIVNVALGGTLYQDIPAQLPQAISHGAKKDGSPARHGVEVVTGSRLAQIVENHPRFEISSLHHQAVKDLGKGLRINARAPDGIIEGIEMPEHPRVVGVQWHPEEDPRSATTRLLFGALIETAGSQRE
jgi:putative glutamine amidotransferase